MFPATALRGGKTVKGLIWEPFTEVLPLDVFNPLRFLVPNANQESTFLRSSD